MPYLPYAHTAKMILKKACRTTSNLFFRQTFKNCDNFFKQKRKAAFWNEIRKDRSMSNNCNLSDEIIENNFYQKFDYNTNEENNFVNNACPVL